VTLSGGGAGGIGKFCFLIDCRREERGVEVGPEGKLKVPTLEENRKGPRSSQKEEQLLREGGSGERIFVTRETREAA